MSMLKNSLIGIRHDPRLLKLPSFLPLLCIVVGLGWLLILPLNQYSRHTYVSENALLPGQVSTYFGGSEHNVFRAYRHEVSDLQLESPSVVASGLEKIFQSQGLKTGRQKYSYYLAGREFAGDNVYAILQGPRADATEALVLMAAWKNMDGVINQSGVALVLSLARYFKRWSLWSKDILFVITSDSTAGSQAWVDAYHSQHDQARIQDLPIKGGALQGAVALDYTAGTNGHRFDKIHLIYDGINGQLPNLDLFNTITHIAKDTMGIGCTIQRMWQHTDSYRDRLATILQGMKTQGLGSASGPHSAFIPYHVDAVTLQAVGDGWHDEVSLGRVLESTFRSLNNLLEHLHQSFFFYILMEAQRFTSIGTYLPAAMLIALNFTISAITLWIHSGRRPTKGTKILPKNDVVPEKNGPEIVEHDGEIAVIPPEATQVAERKLLIPVTFLVGAHLFGVVPQLFFNELAYPEAEFLILAFIVMLSAGLVLLASGELIRRIPTQDQRHQTATLMSCFSLLILGIALSTLATLNFSLSLIIGLLAAPLSFSNVFALPTATGSGSKRIDRIRSVAWLISLMIFSPMMGVVGMAWLSQQYQAVTNPEASWHDGLIFIMLEGAKAWHIDGTYTSVVIWLVWWPAWLIGITVATCALMGHLDVEEQPLSARVAVVDAKTKKDE